MTEIPEHLRKRAEEARAKAAAAEATPAEEPSAAQTEAASKIPEHLRKRAEEARAKAAAAEAVPAEEPSAAQTEAASKIPAHLLERSRAAKAKKAGGDTESTGSAVATATPVGTPPAPTGGPPLATGPEGHTQRLLTVVKSGSIQDVKAKPVDKVHTWPHLLVIEFVAALLITAFTTIFSIFVNAPLLEHANFNKTPNPSKAPWYFLGLQELLTMFHPMVAGVTIPGMGIFLLILAPYMDRNPSHKPEDRKFAISLMTIHMMFWAVLVIIGSFFRGPGFNFVFPWQAGLFFEL